MSGELIPTLPFEDLIQSDLFTFYIGEEKKAFTVHSKAIAATSEHFNALVNGSMMEGTTKSAEFLDVEPEDFARFLEFAYRGDYTVPACTEGPARNFGGSPVLNTRLHLDEYHSPPGSISMGESNTNSLRANRRWKKGKSHKAVVLQGSFKERYLLPEKDFRTGISQGFEPRCNTSPEQDFTHILAAHARLYTFADMRLVQPLKDLAFNKLCKTLLGFKLYDQRVGDIITLARYAYTHGSDRSSGGTIDDLREMVVEYIAHQIHVMKTHEAFKELMEEGGEFVGDLWNLMQDRLD